MKKIFLLLTAFCCVQIAFSQNYISGTVSLYNQNTADGTITVASGASLYFNGGTFYEKGDFINSGDSAAISADSSTLELNGNTSQIIQGRFKLGSLRLTNTAGASITSNELPAMINILDSLSFGNVNGSVLNANGFLTLRSTANKTGRVADITNGGINNGNNISGSVIVERYYHAKRAWRLMTAPLKNASSPTIFDAWQLGGLVIPGSGELITGAAGGLGLDQGINNNSSLKIFTSSTGALTGVSNTNISVSPGTYSASGTGENIGYFNFVRGDRNLSNIGVNSPANITTLSSTGILQTGDQAFTFPLPAVLPSGGENFMLVGNPYACPVKFNSIAADNAGTINGKFWAWDPEAGGPNSVGAYVVYDVMNGYTTPASPGGQTGDIQSGQAVYFSTTKTELATVRFLEKYKSGVRVAGNLFRPMIFTTGQIATNLKFLNADNSTILADGVLAQFNSSFSDSVDIQDGLKFPNVNESFSLMRDAKLLTIERRNPLAQSDTLFFNLTRATQRSYQLEFIANGLEECGLTGYLEDSYLKTSTPVKLTGLTTVNFSIDADVTSQVTNRFKLVFKPSAGPLPLTFTNVKAYQQNTGINVEWNVENETSIKYYEVERSSNGRTFNKVVAVAKGNGVSKAYSLFDAQPNKGDNYYRIKSIRVNGESTYTKIVRVSITSDNMVIVVYPNPVKGNSIELKFTNTVAGKYSLSLYSDDGKKIFTKKINVSTETNTLAIPVHTLAHSIYQLQIINSNSSKATITLKVIVE